MNQEIRNKLRNVVTQCRTLLERDIREVLEGKYGIFERKGHVTADPNANMDHLIEDEPAARKDILDHFDHIQARGFKPKEALDQLVREIAFTHLNRLCAYKMMEAREVYVGDQKFREAVSRGVNSNGVKFYLADHPEEERLFNTGHQDIAYRHFLDWLGGCLSDEIGILFNPNDPANRLYPRQKTLDSVLDLLNGGGIKAEETELREEWPKIWSQDETIGWVYQYFTPKELRDAARDPKQGGSQAPRNSYELAFRNQFFTPRYVVEFLTDNTLGRIWYEMRKGNTKLKDQCRYLACRTTEIFLEEGEQLPKDASEGRDDLSQAELLQAPAHILHRAKKDPRELRILDPASGSGHFLLYCFDLMLTIYEEAYTDPELGRALQKEYPKLEDLQRDVPRLILSHNVHGIDIDVRASQIAALALWLRCQRAYQEMGLKKDRPKINRSNFACAEPMPGEERMLKEFVGQLEPKFLAHVVEVVFEKMKLAGEAGSLLKIEEEIRDAVVAAKKQWIRETTRATDRKGQPLLFTQLTMDRIAGRSVQPSMFDLSDITDAQFFEQAEAKVIEALRQYAEKAHDSQRLQRHLFADDAVRGFAFVDLCQKRYEVVLMNPPFGDPSHHLEQYCHRHYSTYAGNIACAFITRASQLMTDTGAHGAICDNSTAIRHSYADFRRSEFLENVPLTTWITLGWNVLDANVETFVMTRSKSLHGGTFIGLDLRSVVAKDTVLAAEADADFSSSLVVSISQQRALPNSVLDVSWPAFLRRIFSSYPNLKKTGLPILTGHQLEADRHYRLYWELGPDTRLGPQEDWAFAFKGGEYLPFYMSADYVAYVGPNFNAVPQKSANVLRNSGMQFRTGVGYGKRGVFIDAQPLRPDTFFTHEGLACISSSEDDWITMLALLNSKFFSYGINRYCGQHKHNGYVNLFPSPRFAKKELATLKDILTEILRIKRKWGDTCETDYLFVAPHVMKYAGDSFRDIASHVMRTEQEDAEALAGLVERLNTVINCAYHLKADETSVVEAFSESMPKDNLRKWRGQGAQGQRLVDVVRDSISYAVGLSVGHFHQMAGEGPDVWGFTDFFSSWEQPRPCVGTEPKQLLVDSADHAEDIVAGVMRCFETWCGDRAMHWETEAASVLGVSDLREYFRSTGANGFWNDHVSSYSKGSRKAPIYWLLQSSKKNYALWLYCHRYDKDLLFKLLVNYVEPKIRLEASRLETLRRQKAEAGETGKESKRLAKGVEQQEDFISELRDFEDKLRRTANLHLVPDLNDGVVLNIAPLHELVPWKEAGEYWEDLLAGKYEWSSIGKQLRQKGLVK